jgi:hypothetical protein
VSSETPADVHADIASPNQRSLDGLAGDAAGGSRQVSDSTNVLEYPIVPLDATDWTTTGVAAVGRAGCDEEATLRSASECSDGKAFSGRSMYASRHGF